MELPKAGYLVCASPRSGTELLCRGLAATGVAGRPQEYFLAEDPAKLPDWRFWEEGPFAAGHDVSDRELPDPGIPAGQYSQLRVRRQDPLELPAMGAGEVFGDAPLRRPGPGRDPPHRVS